MSKYLLFFWVGLCTFGSSYAWEGVECTIEARASWFHPFSSRIQDVYKNGWPYYEIQTTQEFCNGWALWEGVSGGYVKGHSTCLHNKTEMQLWGIRLGGQREFFICPCLSMYVGAGVSGNRLKIHDHSLYVKEHFSKLAWGAIVQAGSRYFFTKHGFFDLSLEYQYQNFYFSSRHQARVPKRDVLLSGLLIGGGVGFLF